jgi:uncharacterized protein YjiS (DUF1127 family)
MSTLDLQCSGVRQRDRLSGLMVRAQRAADLLLTWHERAQQRRHLQSLNEHMLRDIGLTRADVLAETSKPFWRL